jgi:hypothetical protein
VNFLRAIRPLTHEVIIRVSIADAGVIAPEGSTGLHEIMSQTESDSWRMLPEPFIKVLSVSIYFPLETREPPREKKQVEN